MNDEHRKEIGKYQEEIAWLRSTIANQMDNEKIKSIDDNNSSKVPRGEAVLSPGDDPVADMTRQLITNREKIEVLSRQNERLSKTLHRLREYRLMGQAVSNVCKK